MIIAIALEKLNVDLLQPSRIRYGSISLSVRFDYFSCILGNIDFWYHIVYCGTPKPHEFSLCNIIWDSIVEVPFFSLGLGAQCA